MNVYMHSDGIYSKVALNVLVCDRFIRTYVDLLDWSFVLYKQRLKLLSIILWLVYNHVKLFLGFNIKV